MNKQQTAFTLIELSIVLVIIGLIVGGVLVGQDLIKASKIRKLAAQVTEFETAHYAFVTKYGCLPGDCANATDFWGAQDGGDGLGTDCTQSASTSELTCNGNGDKTVGLGSEMYERFRFWQHLTNAGLIAGEYSGVGDNVATQAGATPGVNVPQAPFKQAGFQMGYNGVIGNSNANQYPVEAGASILLGDTIEPAWATASRPFLSTIDALQFDMKADDGKPGLGKIRSYKQGATGSWASASANCANNTDANLAEYDLSQQGFHCSFLIYPEFR